MVYGPGWPRGPNLLPVMSGWGTVQLGTGAGRQQGEGLVFWCQGPIPPARGPSRLPGAHPTCQLVPLPRAGRGRGGGQKRSGTQCLFFFGCQSCKAGWSTVGVACHMASICCFSPVTAPPHSPCFLLMTIPIPLSLADPHPTALRATQICFLGSVYSSVQWAQAPRVLLHCVPGSCGKGKEEARELAL